MEFVESIDTLLGENGFQSFKMLSLLTIEDMIAKSPMKYPNMVC